VPFYVGAQRPLPKGKRGRCVVNREMLTVEELTVLDSGLKINQMVDAFGFFVYETWECPRCHANIWVKDKVNIARHVCGNGSSGAYVNETLTTSGKVFPKEMFLRSWREIFDNNRS